MNPGITEEVGSTARSVIKVLESQPLALAMILSNFLLLGFVWYSNAENNSHWTRENEQRAKNAQNFANYARDTSVLLSRCVVPSEKEGAK